MQDRPNFTLDGLVDPADPLDPMAERAMAALHHHDLNHAEAAAQAHSTLSWTDEIWTDFASLENASAREILECVLDPAYSSDPRPATADRQMKFCIDGAIPASELPDRLHLNYSCPDLLQVSRTQRVSMTVWNATDGRAVCRTCVTDPGVLEHGALSGLRRRRVQIRHEVLQILRSFMAGEVNWPAVSRAAAASAERFVPGEAEGFLDYGNPQHWVADPIGSEAVSLAVAVGQARGEHLAALWDAAMILTLRQRARTGPTRTRKKSALLLNEFLSGVSMNFAPGSVVDEVDNKLTRKAPIRKRMDDLMAELDAEVSALVARELKTVESAANGHKIATPSTPPRAWSLQLASPSASDDRVRMARIAMSWHNILVPGLMLDALQALNWFEDPRSES